MNQPMAPDSWLAHSPLLSNERLFAVLGSTSDAGPRSAWKSMAAGAPLQSIWAGTAYAGWDEVMPCVGVVEPGSAFLEWVATTQATDWGWLAVSSSPLETVIAHLQGLTKVYLPGDQEVFLRFWDGAQFLPIMQQLGDEAGQVLPVFTRYLVNAHALTVKTGTVAAAKASPWWKVPAPVLEYLAGQSPQTLIDNLLQGLQEQRPDLYAAFALATLQHKVGYFVRSAPISHEALADCLASELD